MLLVSSLLALTASGGDLSSRGSDEVEPRIAPWVHQEVHHRLPQDFAAGTFVRGQLGSASGVRLAPIEQPPNAEDDGSAVFESAPIEAQQPFEELLVSWNVDVPTGAGVWLEVRAGRKTDDEWTDWLRVGEWGRGQPNWPAASGGAEGRIEGGRFRSIASFELAQYRIVGWKGDAHAPEIKVARVDLTLTTRDGIFRPDASRVQIPESAWKRRLPVPHRGRKSVDPKLAPHAGAPASLAMVMEFHGVRRSTEEVAKRCLDDRDGAYDHAARAIQGAYTFGLAGYATRVADWETVERSIAVGQPLVIALPAPALADDVADAAAAPAPTSWLVLTGFDVEGNACVNDPLADSEASGMRTRTRAELGERWLASGGTAYVLLSKR